jgi:signal transduction histidine kinase/CheY-like chemotaxis protein/HPt (histidine-containing phosphotransfer) domain-containing protein
VAERNIVETLRESVARFDELLDHISEAILIVDTASGRIRYCNSLLPKMLGIPRLYLVGKRLGDVLAFEDSASNPIPVPPSVASLKPGTVETHIVRPGKRPEHWQFSIRDFLKGQSLIIVADTTAQAEAEALRTETESLRLSEDFKTELLRNVSHEIRTPVNGIIGLIDIILENPKSDLENRLRRIREAGSSLLILVEDLIQIGSSSESNLRLRSSSFSPSILVTTARDLLVPAAEPAGISVSAWSEFDESILGDHQRLLQILLNLGRNAIAHARPKAISIYTAREEDEVVFYVKDDGCGIPESERSALFESTRQGEGAVQEGSGGAGLGLSICRNLCDAMGGSLALTSAEPGATIFEARIPYKAGEPAAKTESAAAPSSGAAPASIGVAAAPEILIVEDNSINMIIAEKAVKSMGFRADTAASGEAALKARDSRFYDLVLMDCRMPGMEGYETTSRWRKAETENRSIIVALTAHAVPEERERCLAAGMDDFLTKPLDKAVLHKTIDDWLTRLDVERILNAAGDFDVGHAKTLAKEFLKTVAARKSALEKTFAAREWAEAEEIAHGLHGAAANLGLFRLARLMKQIEIRTRKHVTPGLEALLPFAKAEIEEAERLLRALADYSGPETREGVFERLRSA